MVTYIMNDVYHRLNPDQWGCAGEVLEVVPFTNLNEDDSFVELTGVEPSGLNGWLEGYFHEFATRREVATYEMEELWVQIFDILRSDFGRLPSQACYDEEHIELAEDFLASLFVDPPFPVLEIVTGIDSPIAIAYTLDPATVMESSKVIHNDSPMEHAEFLILISGSNHDVEQSTRQE